MPCWSDGGALTPPDTMRTGYTLTGTAPIKYIQTLRSVGSGQFKSTPNGIQQWEGAGVPRVSNMEEVRYPEPQGVQLLQRVDIRYTNRVTRKDSDL